MKKLSTRNKLEMLIGRMVIMLIETALMLSVLFAIIYVVGTTCNFISNHYWLMIPLGLIDFIILIKMINE